MTLAEKAGQMIQVSKILVEDQEVLARYGIGAMLSPGDDGGPRGSGGSAAEWKDMVDGYQRQALKSRLGIPLLYGVDAVHGLSAVQGAVIFPQHIGMGATRDAGLVRRAESVTREETLGAGIRWAFSPCVCVPQDVRWGRTYEGYAEDPEVVSELGAAAVKGLQGDALGEESVLATAKHFVADGGTAFGTGTGEYVLDQGDARISERELREVHLPPYRSAVRAGVGSVMVSYSSIDGLKTHGDRKLITEVLKGELGFEGFVVSDYDGVEQLAEADYPAKVARAVNAGIDMVMVSHDFPATIDAIVDGVKGGKIPQARVDDAVRRILEAKFALGLFEEPYADRSHTSSVGSAGHREVAREAVRASQVLLKNEGGVLPLKKKGSYKIVVGGNGADDLGRQLGGWSITWQGGLGTTTKGTTFMQALRQQTAGSGIEVDDEGRGDIGIWVGGEAPYAEGKGDSKTLAFGKENTRELKEICSRVTKCVAVLYSGRPLIIGDQLAGADAFVASWLPGTEARGITDALFGAGFTGKLPVGWPRAAGDAEALFPLGYGRSPY